MLQEFLSVYMTAWFIGLGVFVLEALFVGGIDLARRTIGVVNIPLFLFSLYCRLGARSFLGFLLWALTRQTENKDINFAMKVLVWFLFVIPTVLLLPITCVLYFGNLIYEYVYRYIYGEGEKKDATA